MHVFRVSHIGMRRNLGRPLARPAGQCGAGDIDPTQGRAEPRSHAVTMASGPREGPDRSVNDPARQSTAGARDGVDLLVIEADTHAHAAVDEPPLWLQLDIDMISHRAQDIEDEVVHRAIRLCYDARSLGCWTAHLAQDAAHLVTGEGANPTVAAAAAARLQLHLADIGTRHAYLARAMREAEAVARTLVVYRMNPLIRRSLEELVHAWQDAHAEIAYRMTQEDLDIELTEFLAAHEHVIDGIVRQPPGLELQPPSELGARGTDGSM